jgi:predicted nucleic acid-binding protein
MIVERLAGGERFIDTNVLVYLFDADAPEKARRSRELLAASGNVVSTQVLQEFYAVVTRKLSPPLRPADAQAALRQFTRLCRVVTLDAALVLAAARRSAEEQVSFWDALVIEAARSAGCRVLLTEDLHHGRVFDQRLVVHDPYADVGGAGLAQDAAGRLPRGRVHRPLRAQPGATRARARRG